MSVDKAFLRNVCLQTEVGREEPKALKARTGSSPGFMEQHVLLLQDPHVQVMQGPALCPLHPGGWICGEPFPAAGRRMQEWRGNKRNKTQRVVGRCAERRDNWVHYTSKGCIHGCNGGLIKIQLYSYFFLRRYSFWSCWREVRKCKGFSQEEKWPRCSLAIWEIWLVRQQRKH